MFDDRKKITYLTFVALLVGRYEIYKTWSELNWTLMLYLVVATEN